MLTREVERMIPFLVGGIHHSFEGPIEIDVGSCVNLRDAPGGDGGYDGYYRILDVKMRWLGRDDYTEVTVERIGEIKDGEPIYTVSGRPY